MSSLGEKKAEENIQDFSSLFWKEEKNGAPIISQWESSLYLLLFAFYSTFMYRARLLVPPFALCALSICFSSSFFKESYKKVVFVSDFVVNNSNVLLNATLFGSKLKSFIEPKICQKGATWHKCYLCWWELCQDFKCSSWSKPSSYSFSFFSDFSFHFRANGANTFWQNLHAGPQNTNDKDAGLQVGVRWSKQTFLLPVLSIISPCSQLLEDKHI